MKNFAKIFILALSLILNFSVVSAEEENVPAEIQKIFDKIDELADTEELAKKNIDLIDEMTYKILQQYPDEKIILQKLYYKLGRAYVMAERYDFAKKYLTLSYQINPNQSKVYFQFGYLESALKNYDKSNQYYEKSIELATENKDKSECENNIGANYFYKTSYTEAIKHFTKSLEYFPTAFTYRNRGEVFADKIKDYSTAIMDFNKAIELDAKYFATRRNCRRSKNYNFFRFCKFNHCR